MAFLVGVPRALALHKLGIRCRMRREQEKSSRLSEFVSYNPSLNLPVE